MFTEYYYVIVTKFIEQSFNRVDRQYRLLWIRFPKSWDQVCFVVPRSVDLPVISRGDKIRIKLKIFTRGLGKQPQLTIIAIEKIEQ